MLLCWMYSKDFIIESEHTCEQSTSDKSNLKLQIPDFPTQRFVYFLTLLIVSLIDSAPFLYCHFSYVQLE